MSLLRFSAAAALLLGLVTPVADAQQPTPPPQNRTGLLVEALAGQAVAVLPLTHLVRDTAVRDPEVAGDRQAAVRWADSLVGDALLVNAPEVNWILPPELRRVARRSAGLAPDPERMGQAVMRSPDLKTVPDPLRSSLRTLVAMAGGRQAFIPASLSLARDEDGAVRATLSVVLADARLGQVVWRAEGIGSGPTAAEAIRAAVASFLPEHRQL